MKYLKIYEEWENLPKKGTITANGKVITISGVGKIDFTGISFDTDPTQMMPEVLPLIKNWNLDFVKNNLGNFSGQYLFNHDDRLFVLVKIGRWIMPFYFSSSGTSGKKIDWHYVFGVDKSGWIIKGGVLPSGEMHYSDFFVKNYKNEINKLESLKLELRNNLPLTFLERDQLVDFLSNKRNQYTKSLDKIYLELDVIEKYATDGVISNENYDYLLNTHLSILKQQS
jgi:hypothetical protein